MPTQVDVLSDVFSFMKSRVILTAAELDLFTLLSQDPISAQELATRLDLDERATTRILDCLITLDYLRKENGFYGTTEKGAQLASLHAQSLLPLIRHAGRGWNHWTHLTAAIREGVNPHVHLLTDAVVSDQERNAFVGAMYIRGKELSSRISAAYDVGSYKRMLDIGGGPGAYTIAFLQKNPQLRAVIFDLENVIPIARDKVKQANLQDRVSFVAGDYHRDELPTGCDLAFLSAVIHQNSPEQNQRLYEKTYRALEWKGVLLIRDHVMDRVRTSPPDGALFALHVLVCTQGGDTYTFEEIKDGLETAGFRDVQMIATGNKMDCLVEARKIES